MHYKRILDLQSCFPQLCDQNHDHTWSDKKGCYLLWSIGVASLRTHTSVLTTANSLQPNWCFAQLSERTGRWDGDREQRGCVKCIITLHIYNNIWVTVWIFFLLFFNLGPDDQIHTHTNIIIRAAESGPWRLYQNQTFSQVAFQRNYFWEQCNLQTSPWGFSLHCSRVKCLHFLCLMTEVL